MNVLGIETSCDETAVAIVDSSKKILSNKLLSQVDLHSKFGGVVPEIAARSHMEYLPDLLSDALNEANLNLYQIDAIAVTGGPGLIGGVIVGVMFAKAIASACKKPFIAVNHLEGHALTVRLTHDVDFPYLLLLLSGGHCQILFVEGVGKYKLLGSTLDDAIGESFDKVSKMLGLGYPGGPKVEKMAMKGDPNSYLFPKPLLNRNNCDFSFSGLKTAVRNTITQIENLNTQTICDICASFQFTVAEILSAKLKQAIKRLKSDHSKCINNKVVLAGGVAANLYIRKKLNECLDGIGYKLIVPPVHLCTDNAAMVAWAGVERLELGCLDKLDFEPKSRWSLI